MASEGQADYRYYPTDGCVSITSQAQRADLNYKVFVSSKVWAFACAWNHVVDQEGRIEDLLKSVKLGLYKKLATHEDFVLFHFYHWAKRRWKPKSKAVKAKLAAHVFMNPEDDIPWLLLFDPVLDRPGDVIRKEKIDDVREDPAPAGEDLEPGARTEENSAVGEG